MSLASQAAKVDFTLAIVNWNTRELLRQCLQSIFEQMEASAFNCQVLVADNASGDQSAEMVSGEFPTVELVRNSSNLGFAKGHEALFQRSKGRYHILVNSDVLLQAGCLEAVEKRMRSEPDIGVLGCRLLNQDGSLQPSCRRFPSLVYKAIEAGGLNRLLPRHRLLNAYKMGDFDYQSARDVDQVMGAFFVIRDKLIGEIGGLDCGFFMYYEEVDYCLRAKQAGYRVFFEPGASVQHIGGASAGKVKVLTIRRNFRSMRRYFRKHHGAASYLPLLLILSLDGVTHTLYALATGKRPLTTFKAYFLAWWDVLTLKPADF